MTTPKRCPSIEGDERRTLRAAPKRDGKNGRMLLFRNYLNPLPFLHTLPRSGLWHGASPTTSMTHIAIQEALDGVAVVWLEKVTDEEYFAGTATAGHAHSH